MRLQAKRELYYTRTIRAGEIFEAKDNHAKTLKALRKAVDAPPEPVSVDPVKPMDTGDAGALVPPRRGRYTTRVMRAEDEPTSAAEVVRVEPGTASSDPTVSAED